MFNIRYEVVMTRIERIVLASTAGEFEYYPAQNLVVIGGNYAPISAVYAAALDLLIGRGPNTPPPPGREIKVLSMYVAYILPEGQAAEGEFSLGEANGKNYARLVWEGDTVPPGPDILIGLLKRMRRAAMISRSQLRSWGGGPNEPVEK
jgi:hypothetical protein